MSKRAIEDAHWNDEGGIMFAYRCIMLMERTVEWWPESKHRRSR